MSPSSAPRPPHPSVDEPPRGAVLPPGTPGNGEDPRGVPPKPRTMGNWRSLVLSMVVILAAILAWLALMPRPAQIQQPPVDAAAVAQHAQRDSGTRVSLPHLPQEWRATSARWGRSAEGLPTWHAGYHRLGDDRTYVAVQQTPASAEPRARESWLAEAVSQGRPDGTVSIDGQEWSKYATSGQPTRRALVLPGRGKGLTTVVGGLATYDDLVMFAGSLRPYGS